MTQKQRTLGAKNLADMLKLFSKKEKQNDRTEEALEENSPNDDKKKENQVEGSTSMESIGEMLGTIMLDQETTFSEVSMDPKFEKALKTTINGTMEMLSGVAKIIKDLPEDGLTVESGLTAVAEAMTKNATRSSSHDFIEYIIHEDKQMAMEIMTKMYDGKSGVKVVWLTLFFIEIGWLTEPSPAAIIDTFNVKKFSKQLYSANKNLSIPAADHKAFSACLANLIDSYKSQNE